MKLVDVMRIITSSLFWDFVDNLCCKMDRFADLYEKRSISNEYKKEYELLEISEQDKILHIGCGAYPLSEIILVKMFNLPVVGIDNNPQSVKTAKEIINKKKLTNKIKIKHGDGINYPIKGFNMVILSSCSTPKKQILNNIINNIDDNGKIIVRELNTLLKPVYEFIQSQKNLKIIHQIGHHPFPFIGPFGWQTIYLKKATN